MLDFNTLVVHVHSIKGIPVKHGRHIDAYASLTVTGTDKWRSKVTTQPARLSPEGSCEWNENLEFSLGDSFTDLTININHKSKIGTSENLASCHFKLEQMPHQQSARAYPVHKKGHPDQIRGTLIISFEFRNVMQNSISQLSLNTIGGSKENKLEKLKRRMNFGKKKAKMDTQSMASVAMSFSRRNSITSNSSALAFSPAASPMPFDSVSLCLPPDPHPVGGGSPNHLLSLPSRNTRPSMDDAISQRSMNIETPAKHTNRIANALHRIIDRDTPMRPTTHNPQSASRPQSIASSGFASAASAPLDTLNEHTSKDYLLSVIDHLRKELMLKERRIQDLEDYTGNLLSRIMEANPELLCVT
ncbi:hypothetical protein M3Y98_00592600 [Aphelenchoides besseyi]|nr:hypothetical protein M3Y98_00592600 [Aphelenchoides besseyi]KAI6193989.1 hypothetical protein M3Y96_01077500 [Aphelenchoides besseyi]